MRFPWHWFSAKDGPKKGALVTEDGKVVKFNYDFAGRETAQTVPITSVVIICNLIPADGQWSAEWQASPTKAEYDVLRNAASWAGDQADQLIHYYYGAKHTLGFDQLEDCVSQAQLCRQDWLNEEIRIFSDPHILLDDMLKSHDWSAQMSDDHSYWAAGMAADKRLKTLLPFCEEDRVNEIWKKYAPAGVKVYN